MKYVIFLITWCHLGVGFADLAPPQKTKRATQETAQSQKSDKHESAQPDPRAEKLLGRWEATHNGVVVFFEFKPDQKCSAGQADDAREGTCTINFTHVPHHLDFMVDGHKGYSILEITPEGLKIAKPDEQKRPTSFTEAALIFKRPTAKGATPTPQAVTQTQTELPPGADPRLQKLIGRWEARFGDINLVLEVAPDLRCAIGQNDDTREGTCVVDFSVTPSHIDFLIDGQPGYSIFEFTPSGLRIAQPNDDLKQRPTQFDHATLIFKPVSKTTSLLGSKTATKPSSSPSKKASTPNTPERVKLEPAPAPATIPVQP